MNYSLVQKGNSYFQEYIFELGFLTIHVENNVNIAFVIPDKNEW